MQESRGSPPPSPQADFEQMAADYDKLPELEEYDPAMEKQELAPGTSVRLTNFIQHAGFNNTQGEIIKREADDGEDEALGFRYHIKLHGSSMGFELRWVKCRNIVVVKRPGSPTPSGGSSRESCLDWNPATSSASPSAP